MRLPLFPLHTVLFPGDTLPVRVFEDRYRALMRDVLRADARLGIVAIRRGTEVGGPAEIYATGTIAEARDVEQLADGRVSFGARGIGRFRVISRAPDDPYPVADVETLVEVGGDDAAALVPAARSALERYRRAVTTVHGADPGPVPLASDPVDASFAAARALALDLPDRQRLLEASDARTRLIMTVELARREALLLETVGPSVGRPSESISPN